MFIRELKQLTSNAQCSAKSWLFIIGFGRICAIYGYMLTGGILYTKYAITYPILTHERNDKVEKITGKFLFGPLKTIKILIVNVLSFNNDYR